MFYQAEFKNVSTISNLTKTQTQKWDEKNI